MTPAEFVAALTGIIRKYEEETGLYVSVVWVDPEHVRVELKTERK